MNRPSALHRIFAALLDFLIVGALCLLCLVPAVIVFINTLMSASTMNIVALFVSGFISGALALIAIIAYSVILPVHWHGQTLGKRFFFMQTKKANGDEVDYKSMFLRVILRVFLVFITFGLSILVDLITLCASKSHLTFYDILASTIVVDAIN